MAAPKESSRPTSPGFTHRPARLHNCAPPLFLNAGLRKRSRVKTRSCNAPSSKQQMPNSRSTPGILAGGKCAGQENMAFVAARKSLYWLSCLTSALRCAGLIFQGREVCAVNLQVLLEQLSLPFVQLEYGTVHCCCYQCTQLWSKSYFCICAKRLTTSCSFTERHHRATYLLIFILDKDLLDGAYFLTRQSNFHPSGIGNCTTLNP